MWKRALLLVLLAFGLSGGISLDQASFDLGRRLYSQKRYAESADVLGTLLYEHPNTPYREMAALFLARARLRNKDYARASMIYAQIARQTSKPSVLAEATFAQAYSAMHLKDYQKAESLFIQYRDRFPQGQMRGAVFYFLGLLEENKQQWQKALQNYNIVLHLNEVYVQPAQQGMARVQSQLQTRRHPQVYLNTPHTVSVVTQVVEVEKPTLVPVYTSFPENQTPNQSFPNLADAMDSISQSAFAPQIFDIEYTFTNIDTTDVTEAELEIIRENDVERYQLDSMYRQLQAQQAQTEALEVELREQELKLEFENHDAPVRDWAPLSNTMPETEVNRRVDALEATENFIQDAPPATNVISADTKDASPTTNAVTATNTSDTAEVPSTTTNTVATTNNTVE